MKIVIVEDEIRIREGLMKLLERIDQNYQVVGEAENGKAGLELILDSKPDLVITDVQMPIMDGLEMLLLPAGKAAPCRRSSFSARILSFLTPSRRLSWESANISLSRLSSMN